VPETAPEFVRRVTGEIMAGRGNEIPVSALPVDGTFPVGTTQYEKRNIAVQVPIWDPELCIHCGQCSIVCPHSIIRAKAYDAKLLDGAPEGFKSAGATTRGFPNVRFSLHVLGGGLHRLRRLRRELSRPSPRPTAKAINMGDKLPILEQERANIAFFETLPMVERSRVNLANVRGSQFLEPCSSSAAPARAAARRRTSS
jgi:pyruvate-ferredoxin/flavodoxin oxidoreductase